MSFCKPNIEIKEGDTVIVYISFNELRPILVSKGGMYHSKYGSFKLVDLIGKKYGCKMMTNTGGRVHILQPTPELWTLCLPHRTQIIYTPNISMITLQLEIKPGSIVVESGTGSASLSHALIRTIFPTGHLHTFEFHAERAEIARNEFKAHMVSDYVTVHNKDVCTDGFGLKNVADAVFLDLPSPWKAISSAKDALKREGGRICSFSPCIEQVQKVVLVLTDLGFVDIETVESLRRVLCVKKYEAPDFDFNMDMKRAPYPYNNENKFDKDSDTCEMEVNEAIAAETAAFKSVEKKRRHSKSDVNNHNKFDNNQFEHDEDDKRAGNKESVYTSKAINIQPGHTGFLTFATLLHKDYHKVE